LPQAQTPCLGLGFLFLSIVVIPTGASRSSLPRRFVARRAAERRDRSTSAPTPRNSLSLLLVLPSPGFCLFPVLPSRRGAEGSWLPVIPSTASGCPRPAVGGCLGPGFLFPRATPRPPSTLTLLYSYTLILLHSYTLIILHSYSLTLLLFSSLLFNPKRPHPPVFALLKTVNCNLFLLAQHHAHLAP
jgi:hypothetical protein